MTADLPAASQTTSTLHRFIKFSKRSPTREIERDRKRERERESAVGVHGHGHNMREGPTNCFLPHVQEIKKRERGEEKECDRGSEG